MVLVFNRLRSNYWDGFPFGCVFLYNLFEISKIPFSLWRRENFNLKLCFLTPLMTESFELFSLLSLYVLWTRFRLNQSENEKEHNPMPSNEWICWCLHMLCRKIMMRKPFNVCSVSHKFKCRFYDARVPWEHLNLKYHQMTDTTILLLSLTVVTIVSYSNKHTDTITQC